MDNTRQYHFMHFLHFLFRITLTAAAMNALCAVAVVVPSSNCYALDNSSRIVDFELDLVVRFCKDVETRSQMGYTDFGRFDGSHYFMAGSGGVDFKHSLCFTNKNLPISLHDMLPYYGVVYLHFPKAIQGFYNGDLLNCEGSYDKLGRTAQVNIICGDCLNGQCKGGLGCICNVNFDSSCRVLVELAVPCEKPGARVFEGFTVGFHPRTWEIVYNGLTQLGFEKAHRDFSFKTEHTHATLYMTAIASLSHLVQKPIIEVIPKKGLDIKLSGSGASGNPPTTLTPTMLILEWTCREVRDIPYEVNITIPVEGYDPIQFFLAKVCERRQEEGGDASKGWAIFGIISFIFIILSTVFCCGGFVYKTRVQRLRGIDALPGMTILSACLETVSGGGFSYSRAEGAATSGFAGEASWERPTSAQGTRQSERKYGSI